MKQDISLPAPTWSVPPTAQQQFGDRVNHHDLIVPGWVREPVSLRCPRSRSRHPLNPSFCRLARVSHSWLFLPASEQETPRVFWEVFRDIVVHLQLVHLAAEYLPTPPARPGLSSHIEDDDCVSFVLGLYHSSCPLAGHPGTVPGARRLHVAGARALNPTSLQTASSSQPL